MHRSVFIAVSCLLLALSVSLRAQEDTEKSFEADLTPMQSCMPTNGLHNYPFDLQRVSAAFAHANRSRDLYKANVKVVVVDNGFIGYELDSNGRQTGSVNFPEAFFEGSDNGLRAFRPITPLLPNSLPLRKGHGTHVTGIILGGMYGEPDTAADSSFGRARVRRLFFDFTDNSGSALVSAKSWIRVYVMALSKDGDNLDPAGLAEINSKIGDLPELGNPNILNLSLRYMPNTNEIPPTIREFPRYFQKTVVIAAAGNQGVRLRREASGHYPAMSEMQDNFIVVGSHDANFRRSTFSNYDPLHVTLSAPGCGILSWTGAKGEAVAANGTSQSSGLVSFAAALLITQWGNMVDPRRVVDRLMISSRYSANLAKGCSIQGAAPGACVRWGNMLDIEMALYYNIDALEYCAADTDTAVDCKTTVALGTLKSIPPEMKKCLSAHARGDSHAPYPTGLSRPGAIRRTGPQSFESLYRPGDASSRLTQGCEMTISSGNFTLLSENEPDKEIVIPASRLIRVVTRSKPNDD